MVDSEVLEQEDYEVKIGSFNGPMDLLVYLVQKKEMTLDQIPIAEIADDFLKWINEYSETDLSKAGDFLFMASRLMALKVQELLPADERTLETEEEYNEDREKLMKEMLEYQRFKQVASGLQEMESKNFGTYSRGRLEKSQNDEETLADANIWQLFRAYQKSLKTKISETIHHIELDYVTIQDRQQAINNFLNVHGRALFEDLLDNDSHPIVAAVTFMAMLEMIKTDDIVFRQSELFGPIWIYRKKNNPEYADEMAHETVFFSKDPEIKAGLVETIRSQAIARSKEKSVGDLAATMREAVLWTERGRNVTEEDLQAMLEGREDISEVQENPFADMISEADAAEGVQEQAGTPTVETPTNTQMQGEATDNTANAQANNIATSTDTTSPSLDTVQAQENTSTSNSESSNETPNEATIPSIKASATSNKFDDIAEKFNTDKVSEEGLTEDFKEPTHTFEPVDESEETIDESVENDISVADTTNHEEQDSSAGENFQGMDATSVQQMSDEEFAVFMQKAQAFYNNANSTAIPTTQTQSENHSNKSFETDLEEPYKLNSTKTSSSWNSESAGSSAEKSQDEFEEDKYSSYSFGNEMTDEEYIAYLNRSARTSRKDEPKSSSPDKSLEKKTEKKSERKSFMPEEEGGMTDEEYQAYIAEHGEDDDDESPVVYGADKN